jgi:hypothetical protein
MSRTMSPSPLRSTMSCAMPVGKTRERACGALRRTHKEATIAESNGLG